jgi:hypothetical protein
MGMGGVYWRTGSQATGGGKSLEDAKSCAEDVAGVKRTLWRSLRTANGQRANEFRAVAFGMAGIVAALLGIWRTTPA